MSIEQKLNLNQIVSDICNKLLHDHKLITTKNVQDIFSELYTLNCYEYLEENFINSINTWRISKLNSETYSCLEVEGQDISNYDNNLYQENHKLKKELSKHKREIQFLQAKIKSINSCYNRQRQEFIMRIQRMLYQANQSNNINKK
ncbi:MAG: hypothetical protein ACR2HS_02820 [Gammaproteobacteria bacterium]